MENILKKSFFKCFYSEFEREELDFGCSFSCRKSERDLLALIVLKLIFGFIILNIRKTK